MKAFFPHHATTDGVTVRVAVHYLPEQSRPASARWTWSYHVRIENGREDAIRLLTRRWRITDGRGAVQEVRGDGVVGDQPVIEAGESYDYVSACPLATPTGRMEGSYGMVSAAGGFDVAIPRFALLAPATAR